MAMKDFAEEQGECERGAGSPETMQHLSPLQIPPSVRVLARIRNETCLHFNQDHQYLVIHISQEIS